MQTERFLLIANHSQKPVTPLKNVLTPSFLKISNEFEFVLVEFLISNVCFSEILQHLVPRKIIHSRQGRVRYLANEHF